VRPAEGGGGETHHPTQKTLQNVVVGNWKTPTTGQDSSESTKRAVEKGGSNTTEKSTPMTVEGDETDQTVAWQTEKFRGKKKKRT